MYLRAVHAESDVEALRSFVRENPLGLFITAIPSPSSSFPTIQCTHIPWVLDEDDGDSEAGLGKLRGHLARANPHSKALVEALQGGGNGALEHEVSVIFTGAAQHYITPRFYTETKPATGKVVPTWNYAAVQVYGRATILHDAADAQTGAYLQTQVEDLTRNAEEGIMGHVRGQTAWEVGDAPAPYVEIMKRRILGVEITIDRLEGKYKMGQELGEGDRGGVVAGFEAMGSEMGLQMARLVEERGAKASSSV